MRECSAAHHAANLHVSHSARYSYQHHIRPATVNAKAEIAYRTQYITYYESLGPLTLLLEVAL